MSKRFQVEVTVSVWGYLTVEADNKDEARKLVRGSQPSIKWAWGTPEAVDTSLFDGSADICIDSCVEDDEPPEASPICPATATDSGEGEG